MDANASPPKRPLTRGAPAPAKVTYAPAAFTDLPGWSTDAHGAALAAFRKSCERLIVLSRTDSKVKPDAALLAVCVKVSQLSGSRSDAEARAFFEQYFVPQRVVHAASKGLLTAYYEPILDGSRTRTSRFSWPLYRRPPDLVNVVDESQRGAIPGGLTHARQTDKGLMPFATRAEIEQGALKGRKLELLYVEHAVDAFFLQIQGSARVRLPDGDTIRVGYDGKNGHPYTSIGKVLIDQGEIPVERMSLRALAGWLKANAAKARDVMWANKSFVFFKEHAQKEASGPEGVHNITLTPGRSLAIDPSFHALGSPIYVTSPEIKHMPETLGAKPTSSLRRSAAAGKVAAAAGFHRLMIAQDVGSAIKGPERGDIYAGSGDAAGKIAGITKHPGNFFVLVPRTGAARPAEIAGRTSGATTTPVATAPTSGKATPAATPTATAAPPPAAPTTGVGVPSGKATAGKTPAVPEARKPVVEGVAAKPAAASSGEKPGAERAVGEKAAAEKPVEKTRASRPVEPSPPAQQTVEEQLRTSLQ